MRRQYPSCSSSAWMIGTLLLLFLIVTGCTYNPLQPASTATPSSITVTPGGEPAGKPVSPLITAAFPSSAPLACPQSQGSLGIGTFVTTQNTQFLFKGTPLKFYGYTFYPALIGGAGAWRQASFSHYIDSILDMGEAAGQNLVRPTDFWEKHHQYSAEDQRIIWQNMDYLVCAASQRGIFINMDISAFEWFLQSQHNDVYDVAAWKAFIDAVASRYKDQSAIAFYSLLGEPEPPKTVAAMDALVNFYRATTDELHKVDGNHLITAGGFTHMEDESSEIPWWRSIYSLPHNDIGAFKTYSQKDLLFISTITEFTKGIGKPALDEEFGMPQKMGDATYTGELYNSIRTSRADFFENVYTEGEGNGVAGFIFWNLGCEIKASGYEVSPKTPAVWHVIQKHAPSRSASPDKGLMC